MQFPWQSSREGIVKSALIWQTWSTLALVTPWSYSMCCCEAESSDGAKARWWYTRTSNEQEPSRPCRKNGLWMMQRASPWVDSINPRTIVYGGVGEIWRPSAQKFACQLVGALGKLKSFNAAFLHPSTSILWSSLRSNRLARTHRYGSSQRS